jgi:hypothetical protein
MDKMAQEVANTNFFRAMREGGSAQQGLEERATLYIKRRLREEGFARKVIEPQSVNKYELQREVSHDSVYAVIDIEPKSTTMQQTFRGEPTGHFFTSDRYVVPFFSIETEVMEKTVGELYAYQSPVIQIIQENQVKDIEEMEDSYFTNLCHTAVAATNQLINDAAETQLTNLGVAKLLRLIAGNRLDPVTLLMNAETWTDVLAFDTTQLGEDLRSKIQVDGYSYDKWLGKNLILTTKTNIVQENEVWAFAKQKYLGHFLLLQGLQFYIQQVRQVISWSSWEIIGINLGNILGVGRYRFGTGVGLATTVTPEGSFP